MGSVAEVDDRGTAEVEFSMGFVVAETDGGEEGCKFGWSGGGGGGEGFRWRDLGRSPEDNAAEGPGYFGPVDLVGWFKRVEKVLLFQNRGFGGVSSGVVGFDADAWDTDTGVEDIDDPAGFKADLHSFFDVFAFFGIFAAEFASEGVGFDFIPRTRAEVKDLFLVGFRIVFAVFLLAGNEADGGVPVF